MASRKNGTVIGVSIRLAATLLVLCFALQCVECHKDFPVSSTGKPLVKRPAGGTFKVLLSVDGGGPRGIIPVITLIELEHSIKQYLLSHPEFLPTSAAISSTNDFDINLVDYFDCMTGISSGNWAVLYLASRGGQGASKTVLEDPSIIEKYGVIPIGGAEGLRVFYREYSSLIYPYSTLDPNAGTPFDISNPNAPGVASPLFTLDGVEAAMEAFLGNTTLADVDTSALVPTVDLITGYTVFFVQNAFRSPPVTSSAKFVPRSGPKTPQAPGARFSPDLTFDEGKDYYLKDIGVAATTFPMLSPAKPVSEIGSGNMEYLLVDGAFPFESATIPAAHFVSIESGAFDFEKVAILSLGVGLGIPDFSRLANAGAARWLEGNTLLSLFGLSGQIALPGTMDYIYYSDPETSPYQYLRVQREAQVTTEEGMALEGASLEFFDDWEVIGRSLAEEHRASIDAFVKGFIFA